ncbi:ABC transporter ATP-binding protein/permease [Candidatus Woesearchaeota archaeon]|nr:ABC transporter ATP-binding protein/permease [Candidatus Woesearchaeota archaeon]MBW3018439.1 ABC transporter ATP-binding protein/permease [Candidatus Woesearchaeota archaeon]
MNKKKQTFFKKAIRIVSYARPFWKIFLMLIIITIVLSLLEIVNPYLIKILIDDIFIAKNYGLLVALMLFFIFVFFLKTIVGIFFSYQAEKLEENVVLGVKRQLFKHLEKLDLGFFYTKQLGDILVRLDEDVYGIESFIGILIDSILMNVLTGTFILVICFLINWKVTLSCLAFFPFFIITQKYFGQKIKKQRKKLIEIGAGFLSFLQESIVSIKTIKTFVLENLKLKKYTRTSRRLIREDLKLNLLESYSGAVVGLITFTPLLIILWYGGFKVITGALTVGSLMALYTYIGKLFGPISELGSINVAIQSTMVSVDRVFEFLDRVPKIQDKKGAIELKDVKGKLEFKNVSFFYNKDEPVLENISLTIKPGESIGLVGPSGSGKSTIANLVGRFFDPVKGKILLDGIDLRDIKVESLRKNSGIVSQDTILFNTSIKENIRLGNLKATDKQIEEAAKLANIHDFIMSLKHGYNTKIGERGVNLSGGQQQRLSIARTILKNPKILILDEATSSLDTESEQKIQDAMNFIMKGRTTIIIAHRLSTIHNVNKIVVLKDHGVAEIGGFDELIKKKGIFYHYYNIQFRDQNNYIPEENEEQTEGANGE